MDHLLVAVRAHGWLSVLASLSLLGLLLAFHQVVRSAVRQGELRREIATLHSTAAWRCNAMRGRPDRDSCLQELNAAPLDPVALRARNALTIAAHEQLDRRMAVVGP
jgi:hypothetical protein